MATPNTGSTLKTDDVTLDAFTSVAGIATLADTTGMPQIGSLSAVLEFSIDIRNTPEYFTSRSAQADVDAGRDRGGAPTGRDVLVSV